MKTIIQTIMIASILSMLTGCTHVPAINAKRVFYDSSYPIGGSTIEIKGVEVTETEVKAESYHRKSKWWGFTQEVIVEGYSRERTKADAPAPSDGIPVK